MFKLCLDIFTSSNQKVTIRERKKKSLFYDLLAFCFFYVHSLNATDHLHENMQYSRDDDNNIDVKKN